MHSEQDLISILQAWDAAMVSNDAAAIGQFMTDDWVIVGTEGGITSKGDFLSWIRSGAVTHYRMDSDEMKIRLYGDTAVVISRGTSAGHYKGKPFELYEWSSNVFLFAEGEWKCVMTMLTPAVGEKK